MSRSGNTERLPLSGAVTQASERNQQAWRFIRVRWRHQDPVFPVELWSELDDQRYEVRKIEVWSDGRVGYAVAGRVVGDTKLSVEPIPPLSEIAEDPQFEPEVISEFDFERWWKANVR